MVSAPAQVCAVIAPSALVSKLCACAICSLLRANWVAAAKVAQRVRRRRDGGSLHAHGRAEIARATFSGRFFSPFPCKIAAPATQTKIASGCCSKLAPNPLEDSSEPAFAMAAKRVCARAKEPKPRTKPRVCSFYSRVFQLLPRTMQTEPCVAGGGLGEQDQPFRSSEEKLFRFSRFGVVVEEVLVPNAPPKFAS